MKKGISYTLLILFSLLMLLPVLGYAQPGTWPIRYSDEDPTTAPSGAGTRVYFNTATNTLFFWEPAPSSQWRKQPKAFEQITGCAAPAYTPTARQSTFVVNSCTPTPGLYEWTGGSWALLNPGGSYTAGANIDITGTVISLTGNLPVERFNGGTNAASNTYWRGDGLWASLPGFLTSLNGLSPAVQTFATSTAGTDFSIQSFGSTHTFRLPTASATNRGALSSADWTTFNSKDPSSTNEIQTLSIAGQDLSLSLGGGTVTIPAGADGNGIYSGSGTIPIETTATLSEDSYFTVGWFSGGQALYINDEEGQVELKSKDNLTNFYLNNFGLGFGSENDIQFTSLGTLGFTAAIAEFSGGVRIGQFTNAAAPVNTIFYSTTDSKLSYKDPGGAVHGLY